jgi:hypothetical protein
MKFSNMVFHKLMMVTWQLNPQPFSGTFFESKVLKVANTSGYQLHLSTFDFMIKLWSNRGQKRMRRRSYTT